MTGELAYLSIAEAAGILRKKLVSPVELVRSALARIEVIDPMIGAYAAVLGETALAEARVAEEEIGSGSYRGALHGIPIGIKDLVDVRGCPTIANSRTRKHKNAERDAEVVRRLRAAGAVIIGKQACWEFGLGGPAEDLVNGLTRNPWDLDRDPGGSSSGSAAAVAAGLAMGAIATDTGGSIRHPAALCGAVGLKPTYGRVSRDGVIPLAYSMDHVGTFTRTVEDAALMLQAISGSDPKDRSSAGCPVPLYAEQLGFDMSGIRLLVPRHIFEHDGVADPLVRAAFEQSLRTLSTLGLPAQDVRLPSLQELNDCALIVSRSEAFAQHAQGLRENWAGFGRLTRQRLSLGCFISAPDYIAAHSWRASLIRRCESVVGPNDILVLPTAADIAPVLGSAPVFGRSEQPVYTRIFNLLGWPALSLPNGFSESGLPTAIQLAGRPFSEGLLLKLAHALERATPFWTRHPVFAERDSATTHKKSRKAGKRAFAPSTPPMSPSGPR